MGHSLGVKLLKWIDTFLSVFLVCTMTLVTVMAFTQVVLRYVFSVPLMGIEELLLFPTTWLYMFGAIKASQERNHIVAKVLEIFIHKKRFTHLLHAVAAAISTVVLCWLCVWGYDLLKYTLRVKKVSATLYLPLSYSDGIVFFALSLMVIYSVIECVDEVKKFLLTSSDVVFTREVS